MDFGRQIIRYSIPGGVFVFLTSLYLVILRIAWYLVNPDDDRLPGPATSDHKPFLNVIGEILDPLTANLLVSIVGMLIAGYLIYQIYYHYYRPAPVILRWRPVRLQPKDRGGEILKHLLRVQGAEGWLNSHFRATESFAIVPRNEARDDRARKAWYEHNEIVRSLVNFAAQENYSQIKEDLGFRSDMYHSLGACRFAVWLSTLCAVAYVFLAQGENIGEMVERTLIGLVVVLFLTRSLHIVFDNNRSKAWLALTQQVGHDLALWYEEEHHK